MSWSGPEFHNVAGALADQARTQGRAAAIHYPTGLKRWGGGSGKIKYSGCTYAELNERSDTYARGLHEFGIGRGARAALMMPPGLEFFAMFFAMFKAGVVPVLIDPGIGLKPLKECLREAAPEAFIGVSRAQAARSILKWAPESINKLITHGPIAGWGGLSIKQLSQLGNRTSGAMLEDTAAGEMAAILFTSGSTGIPKGVVYRHRHFTAQVEMLRTAFDIKPGEVDLPTFPPFALFDPALGMTTVIPWMDPTKPARAKPELLVQAIERFSVTNIFGSPALLRVLGDYTHAKDIKLPNINRFISAGASVPTDAINRMKSAFREDANIFTPYGATECLPVASISSSELGVEIEAQTRRGEGICVGKAVVPNKVGIMAIKDHAIEHLDEQLLLPTGVAGEIIVHGPTTTDAYWMRDEQTRLAKMTDDQGNIWHRMGDIGYLDESDRIWFCGRKSQRVAAGDDVLFTDQTEAVFNAHPEVLRTALVNAVVAGKTLPVLCVELSSRPTNYRQAKHRRERIRTDLLQMAKSHARLTAIKSVLFHKGFPVDIRHNAKIGREKLAHWAQGQLQ